MKAVRRVVTGVNDKGQSTFISDSGVADVFGGGGMEDFSAQGSLALAELWATAVPADNVGNKDGMRPGEFNLEPNPGSLMVRIAEFPPEPAGIAKPGAGLESHPGFHITQTTDIIIVLEGEVYSMMETGETLLKAGDVLIQRGTNHAWSNRSGKVTKIAAIMINAKKK
ncbi:MAG: cupin domain-containing protein [Porticoccaceae bacterium]